MPVQSTVQDKAICTPTCHCTQRMNQLCLTLGCSVLMSFSACASALTAPASRIARTTSRDMALLAAWRGSLLPATVVPLLTSAPIKLMQADACAGHNAHIRTQNMVSTAQQNRTSYMAPAVLRECVKSCRKPHKHPSTPKCTDSNLDWWHANRTLQPSTELNKPTAALAPRRSSP